MENTYSEEELYEDFCRLGVKPNSTLVLHSSLSSLGYVIGGAVSVINALLNVLGGQGTLMVPTHTPELSDPEIWTDPPVPERLWQKFREATPIFDPALFLPVSMGIIPCTLLGYPNVERSYHPLSSFAAVGKHAAYITADHSLKEPEGWSSPVGKLYELDGWVLLMGVDNRRNTSLHLAEVAADVDYIKPHPKKPKERIKVKTDSRTRFITLERSSQCSEGFIQAEPYLRNAGLIRYGMVGDANCQLMKQREAVDLITQVLKKDPKALLCDETNCPQCSIFQ